MEFYKQFLQDTDAGGTGVYLAAFGKHPGWDDHIPDIGLQTDTLVLLKRVLYVRGIGGLIDSGVWDNMSPDDVLPGFDHTFVGQRGGDTIIGRMWASTDGKGRSKYPMVVVAHVVGLPLDRCLGSILKVLEELHLGCVAVETAAEVIALIGSVQQELNGLVGGLQPCGDLYIPSRHVLRRMLDGMPLADPEKHRRLLYEIRNRLEPFSYDNAELAMEDESHSGEHLRLPVDGFRDQADSYLGWIAYLRTQISDKVPILLISPIGKPWMDVIAGLFTGLQLSCLRGSLRKVPCVTEIEYNIPQEFSDSVAGLLTGIANWEETPLENSVFGPPAKMKLTKRMVKAAAKVADQASSKAGLSFFSRIVRDLRKNRLLLGAIIACVLVVVVILLLSSGDSGESLVDDTGKPGKVAQEQLVVEGAPETVVQAWKYLSAADEWYPRFLRYARNASVQDTWNKDNELSRILGLINSPEFYGLLDKVGNISSIASQDLPSLGQSRQTALGELALQVQGIEAAVKNWSVYRNTEQILSLAKRNGWNQLTDELKRTVPPVLFNRDLGVQINDQLNNAGLLQKTAANLSSNSELVEKLSRNGLSCLSGIEKLNQESLGTVSSMAVLNDSLVKQNATLEGLLELVTGGSSAINEDLLLQDPRYKEQTGTSMDRLDVLASLLEDYRLISQRELPDFQFTGILSREQLVNQLNSLKELEPDLDTTALVRQWDTATAAMAGAAQIPRVRINRKVILSGYEDAVRLLEDLRTELGKRLADHSDPSGWYANLPFLLSNSSPLHGSWVKRIELLVPVAQLSGLAADTEKYIQMRQQVDNWLRVYQDIDAFLENLSLNDIAENSSRTRLARHELLQNLYLSLARESAIELADGLERPLTIEPQGMKAFLEWQAELESTFRKPLVAMEADLDRLQTSLEQTGEGSFQDLAALLNQFWPSGEFPGAIMESYLALQELLAASSSNSLPELLEVFDDSQWPGVRWMVWGRINQISDWPMTLADLNRARDLGTRMTSQGLQGRDLDASLRSHWERAMAAALNRQSRLELWSFFNSMGWSSENLSQQRQFDKLVASILSRQVSSIGREDAISLRDTFIKSAMALTELSSDQEMKRFLDALKALTFEEGNQIDRELLINAGPGSAGWSLANVNESGSRVQYVWNSEHLKNNEGYDEYALSFILMESESGERLYVGTNEISCGLFFDWINERNGWNVLVDFFPARAFGSAEGSRDIEWRSGPRAWTLADDRELVVAYDWQLQPNTQGVPVLQTLANDPGRFSPVNYITGPTSKVWTESIGCRLPSPEEFTIATSGLYSDNLAPNLRDASWLNQLNYLKQEMSNAFFTTWPDQECFSPEEVTFPRGADAVPATNDDDGILWFRDVGVQGENWDSLHNIRGNVSELLYEPDSGQYFVVGGSALSPAEIVWDRSYQAPSMVDSGSSDVGFRVVFEAPVPLPGRILVEAFAKAPDPAPRK